MRFLPFFILCLFLSVGTLSAQQLQHVQGDLLVQFPLGMNARSWTLDYQKFQGENTQLSLVKKISDPVHIWQLYFDFTKVDEKAFLSAIRRDDRIIQAQFNHFLEDRAVPNDELFSNQWQYINTGQSGGMVGADMDADLAWDTTTGGLTAEGDTIVVCVIDNGVQLDHPDLVDNLWRNHAEIPGNGIDDDDNGFIDDYLGWNVLDDDDDVSGGNHGTAVSGIVGAKGNNLIGVAGVNWDVKLMIVDHELSATEARAIEAYSYALVHRKRYNETDGEEGAFVVATNSSWGIDNAPASEAPLWCAMYDTLGQYGILNAGATTNSNTNVDFEGDLPTSCPSDFLMSVTNMNHNDEKEIAAGFGVFSIDLGAFGANVYTTNINSSYGNFGGTSGATPQVAGAMALLYASPCPDLVQIAKSDPATAAALVRDYILDGVDANESLDGITVTGGRLNINNSMELLMEDCGSCVDAFGLEVIDLTDVSASFGWTQFDNVIQMNLRWRERGSTTWTTIEEVTSPFTFADLLACTEYEVQLQSICEEDTLPFSDSFIFETDGCCDAPEELNVTGVTESVIALGWSEVFAASSYSVRFKPSSGITWTTLTTFATFIGLPSLMACEDYDIQIRANCANGDFSDFSETLLVTTLGCGGCLDFEYCEPDPLNADGEWIERVVIGDMENISGPNGGYGDFTGMEAIELNKGQSIVVEVEPGYSGTNWAEYFQIWIDLNKDGFFAQAELVYDPGEALNTPQSDSFIIPEGIESGSTRLRVAMQFLDPGGPCSFGQEFGEVEDYCVNIVGVNNIHPINGLLKVSSFPNPFTDQLNIYLEIEELFHDYEIDIINIKGQSVWQQSIFTSTLSLSAKEWPSGLYIIQLKREGELLRTQKMVKK